MTLTVRFLSMHLSTFYPVQKKLVHGHSTRPTYIAESVCGQQFRELQPVKLFIDCTCPLGLRRIFLSSQVTSPSWGDNIALHYGKCRIQWFIILSHTRE